MEIRHLDALLAITEAGSFSRGRGAAHGAVQRLRADPPAGAGARCPVLVRGRRGPPDRVRAGGAGAARRIRASSRRCGSTCRSSRASRPATPASGWSARPAAGWSRPWSAISASGARRHAPHHEGASERLAAEVVSHEVTMAVVTEPIVDPRLTSSTSSRKTSSDSSRGLRPAAEPSRSPPWRGCRSSCPIGNPSGWRSTRWPPPTVSRSPSRWRSRACGSSPISSPRPGASILPRPPCPGLAGLRTVTIAGMPPRVWRW